METIKINVDPAYDVLIGCNILNSCGSILRERLGTCRAAVITDSNVKKLYLKTVTDSLSRAGFDTFSYTFPAGEASKNMTTLSDILEHFAENGLARSDSVIALGGGVVGDISGFAAGCYMRGVRFFQMPTTLLAAVDSSVGGKTAADLRSGKNLAGLFIQPSAVLCDINCLSTLPVQEMKNGFAEAVKTAILTGGELYNLLLAGSPDMEYVISRCVAYKGGVTERDELENGERKLLNLGHTVGHAIELLSGYTVPHGLSVSAGLAVISRASARLGWCDKDTARAIISLLNTYSLPISTEYSAKALSAAALRDKKRSGDEITLAIPENIGGCTLKNVKVSELESIISAGLEAL